MTEKLHSLFSEFESYLISQPPKVPSFHPYYEKALWEMVLSGGKRFRPKLLLSVVYANKSKFTSKAFAPALALEILHTYSLIHDDLPAMDNATLRRGVPTLHHKYDECGAILVGDALNTHSFYCIAKSSLKPKIKNKLTEILSYNGGIYGMVLGQALDCYFEKQTLPLKKLRIIHLNKTAKLIAAALKMGGIIAKCDKKFCQKLYKIGLDLGLFFQIRDDIIDATQSSQEAGKTTQNDSEKNSYVNLLGLETAKIEAKKLQESLQMQLQSLNPKTNQALRILLEEYFTF
ncbi:polyprenyl synthetase family protein [Helicobacter sp. 14348-15]|uniref:polyprenyl synthetase family protein n=1 Tax=Helicobacter TaxID=209 RepID=UPI00202B9EC7|nr:MULTISPECIES: polyprenyl synthetase family protein [Helicobacter]MCI7765333.1 polyprenyl synthetase family protein [Helicobacter sp.]MCL9821722.1 polyprenyl synthetase family protein [Helicobacter colisuis]